MGQKIIVGNWKMHGTLSFAKNFLQAICPHISSAKVMLAVPYPLIFPLAEEGKKCPIIIGAQNVHQEESGAFTGEVSAPILKEVGAGFVLIGHSERRQFFQETDCLIRKKILTSIEFGLLPILCIGETLAEREAKKEKETLKRQMLSALEGFSSLDVGKIMIAYEPVWAIGTGKSATPAQAEEMHDFCRSLLVSYFGEKTANLVPLLYGGSVNPDNASQLFHEPNIDGALVGGASLKAESFLKIIQSS